MAMGNPGVVSGDNATLLGVPGFIDFMWKELPIHAQGYSVHLSIRVNLHHQALCPILCRKHQAGVE